MKVTYRMCGNPDCGWYRISTKLLGGCDCGHALEPYRSADEPSNEILGNLIEAFSMSNPETPTIPAAEAAALLNRAPALREAWLIRHGEVQVAIWGAKEPAA